MNMASFPKTLNDDKICMEKHVFTTPHTRTNKTTITNLAPLTFLLPSHDNKYGFDFFFLDN